MRIVKFLDTLQNNDTKYLLIFDNSKEKICISKAFVDFAIAGTQRGLSTIHIKHNFFHQSKVWRQVELQNLHFVLFKSLRDVMQVSMLSAHLGLGADLVDCNRDAKSVHYGNLLINFSPRTDDRLRYCTNTGSILPKFYVPESLKHLKFLNDEHTKCLYPPRVPIVSHKCKKSFLQSYPKELIRLICECLVYFLKRNLQSIKKHIT